MPNFQLKDHLEKVFVFRTVAKVGAITKSTKLLNLTQPTISRTIRLLENAIEKELLVRSINGVKLTPAGELLLKFSDRLTFDIETLERQMDANSDEFVGKFDIGCYESLAAKFLPQALKAFAKFYPNMKAGIHTSSKSQILIQKLEDREIGVAICISSTEHKNIVKSKLYRDGLSIYYSPKSYLLESTKNSQTVDTLLEKLPLILIPDAELNESELLKNRVWSQGLSPNQTFEVETFEIAKEYAVTGMGAAILPGIIAADAVKKRELIKMPKTHQKFGKFDMNILTRRDSINEESIKRLLSCINDSIFF